MKGKSCGDNSSESSNKRGHPAHSARGGGRKANSAKLAARLEGTEEQPVDVAGGNPSKRGKQGEVDDGEENAGEDEAVDEDNDDEDNDFQEDSGRGIGWAKGSVLSKKCKLAI